MTPGLGDDEGGDRDDRLQGAPTGAYDEPSGGDGAVCDEARE